MAEIEHTADVEGMLDRIGPKQFRRWRAWFRVREARDWRRAATIAAAVHNAALITKGVTDPQAMVDVDHFIPPMFRFTPPEKPVSGQTIHNSLAAAYGPKY